MGPVAIRSQFSDFFGSSMLPVLEEVFQTELEQQASMREMLFKVVSHDRDIYQSSELHDMDLFVQVGEGENYTFTRPKQGAAKTLTMKKWGLGFSISEEMVDDGKFEYIANFTKKLAKSGRESQEISAANILNNGFSSSVQTADGVNLFSTAHTLPSGLTFRNKLSTDADLSPSSLEQAAIDFSTVFIGDSGIKYRPKPKYLVVPPALRLYAKEIVGSVKKADTADNNMNSLAEEGLQVVEWNQLTDSDAWFLVGDKEDHGLRIISRKPMETKAAGPDVGFQNDSILYKARYREEVGALHPYAVFGTSGA